MSAIPSTGVNFDFTGNASGLDRVTRDAEKRVAQMARAVNATKIEATPRIDIGRLERDAQRSKEILRGIQREADQLSAIRIAGGGGRGGGGGGGGGLMPTGTGPLGSGVGGDDDGIGRGLRAGTILRFGVMIGDAAAVFALAARDMKLAAERGDLAGEVRAEAAKNAFARSMPFGIGEFGANLRELGTGIRVNKRGGVEFGHEGERAGLERTQFEAEQNDQKTAFMARQNEQMRAKADLDGKQAAQRQKELEQSARSAAERERIEGDTFDRIISIREKAGAEALELQGKHIEAERAQLINGARETQRELERIAQFAENIGQPERAALLRGQRAAQKDLDDSKLRNFDAEQEQKERDRRGKQDSDFEDRKRRAEAEDEKRTAEGRERGRRELVRDLEEQIRDAEHGRIGPRGRAVSNPLLTAPTAVGSDQATQHLKDMKELLKQIRDKDYPATTT